MTHSDPHLPSRRTLLRNGALLAAASSFTPSILTQALDGEHRWTISNTSIRRVLSFRPESGLITEELSALTPSFDFVSSPPRGFAQEFSFRCNDHFCAGASADFTLSAEPRQLSGERDMKSLIITLRYKSLPLEVDVVYAVYTGHPAIRKHLQIRNTGSPTLHLSHLTIESLPISLGPENEITVLTQYGAIPREIFYTGRSEDAGLFIANGSTGNGIAVISEVPGYMKRTEIAGWDNPNHVRIGVMYDTDIMPFERSLAAGETFITAAVSLIPIATETASTTRTGPFPPTPPKFSNAASTNMAHPGSTTPGSHSSAPSITTSPSNSSMPPLNWASTSSPSTMAGNRSTATTWSTPPHFPAAFSPLSTASNPKACALAFGFRSPP
jgi:hypothetical protein